MNVLTVFKHLFLAMGVAVLVSSCASLNNASSSSVETDDMYFSSKDRKKEQEEKRKQDERMKANTGRHDVYTSPASSSAPDYDNTSAPAQQQPVQQTQQATQPQDAYTSQQPAQQVQQQQTQQTAPPQPQDSYTSQQQPAQQVQQQQTQQNRQPQSRPDTYSGQQPTQGYGSHVGSKTYYSNSHQNQGRGQWKQNREQNQEQPQGQGQWKQQQQPNNKLPEPVPTAQPGQHKQYDSYQPELNREQPAQQQAQQNSSSSKADVYEFSYKPKHSAEGTYNPNAAPQVDYSGNSYAGSSTFLPVTPLYPGFNPYGALNITFGYYPWYQGAVYDPFFYKRYTWGARYGYRPYLGSR